MDYKNLFAIISILFSLVFFLPYLRDIFRRTTKPHAYTWMIWSVTQGTALAGMWKGGGGAGAWALCVSTVLVFIIFLLSLKYGTKNITISDKLILIAAGVAILVWWQLKNPTLAIYMVTAIDLIGFIPSFRKSFEDPWSETVISWVGSVASYIFAIAALSAYNPLTLTYFVAMTCANIILIVICLARRMCISQSGR